MAFRSLHRERSPCPSWFETVLRDVFLSRVTSTAMEPPTDFDATAVRDEKVKVLRAIPPLEPKNVVRGQFRGYRDENGVASNSQVETFAALRLEVDSWRWRGVPFYIRAGKSLPVTCTEVLVQLHQPPTMYKGFDLKPNYCRFRISPDVTLAFCVNVLAPTEDRHVEREAFREDVLESQG